jgi:hypothetical protein
MTSIALPLAHEGTSRTNKMARGLLELTAIADLRPQPRGRASCSARQNGSFPRPSSLGPASRG